LIKIFYEIKHKDTTAQSISTHLTDKTFNQKKWSESSKKTDSILTIL